MRDSTGKRHWPASLIRERCEVPNLDHKNEQHQCKKVKSHHRLSTRVSIAHGVRERPTHTPIQLLPYCVVLDSDLNSLSFGLLICEMNTAILPEREMLQWKGRIWHDTCHQVVSKWQPELQGSTLLVSH